MLNMQQEDDEDKQAWVWGRDKLRCQSSYQALTKIFFEHGEVVPELVLPSRSKIDYYHSLETLLDKYCSRFKTVSPTSAKISIRFIKFERDLLLDCLRDYHAGLPSKAFKTFSELMFHLVRRGKTPDTDAQRLPKTEGTLFRMRDAGDARSYGRSDIFHVPFNLRHIVSTSRYGIAGYPSLYLTDSLELAQKETGNPRQGIASRFELHKIGGKILDFGIRPQDFDAECGSLSDDESKSRSNSTTDTGQRIEVSDSYAISYLTWYPLIAACSFVRAFPDKEFADEYIIPQMLMQWLRQSNFPPNSNSPTSPDPNGPDSGPDSNSMRYKLVESDSEDNKFESRLLSLSKDLLDSSSDALSAINEIESMETLLGHLRDLRADVRTYITQKIDEPDTQENRTILEDCHSNFLSLLERFVDVHPQSPDSDIPRQYSKEGGLNSYQYERKLSQIRGTIRPILADLNWYLHQRQWIGIRYFSCKNLCASDIGRNYVFPTRNCDLNQIGEPVQAGSDGFIDGQFCSYLNRHFTWTNPVCMNDYTDVQHCEKCLIDLSETSCLGSRPPA